MFKLNDKVAVKMGDWKFESTVVDIVDNPKSNGVWVDHPQLQGKDMIFVDLSRPTNSVEIIEDKVEKEEFQNIKEIRKELQKAIKWIDEDDKISVNVKVYDCCEFDEQTYDVEINLYINGEYEEGWLNDTFFSRFKDGEDELALKQAKKRASAVLRTVKGWFKYDDHVTVENGVEVYHA